MKKKQIELERGSGNAFRDVGLPNPELQHARATLAGEIMRILNKRELTNSQAAEVTGIDRADIARIRNADLAKFSIDRMIKILERLEQEIEITVRPSRVRRRSSIEAQVHV